MWFGAAKERPPSRNAECILATDDDMESGNQQYFAGWWNRKERECNDVIF
jgi:hypothetical protein